MEYNIEQSVYVVEKKGFQFKIILREWYGKSLFCRTNSF